MTRRWSTEIVIIVFVLAAGCDRNRRLKFFPRLAVYPLGKHREALWVHRLTANGARTAPELVHHLQ